MKDEQDLISYSDDNFKMGFKNRNGQIIIPAQWNMVYDFHEGLAMVQNGNCGFINTKGEVVVPLEWDCCEYFSEGLAVVKKDDKCGYINKAGELVIPLVWNYAHPFFKGRAIVFDDKQRYIDKQGKVIWTRERTAPEMIKISENCEIDINDVVIVDDWRELGEFVTEEEFLDALGVKNKCIDDELTEEERELFKKAGNCTTIEELQNLEKETSTINEGIRQTSHIITDMTVEEFTKKYDLIDIKDLKGKYGF